MLVLEIILTRYLSVETPISRISLGFIPICFVAIKYGPKQAALIYAISDILGMMLFPKGLYFPGFTLTSIIVGYIYGIFLYRKPMKDLTIIIMIMAVGIVHLILNSAWLSLLIRNDLKYYFVIFIHKIPQFFIMSIIQYFLIKYFVCRVLVFYNQKHPST
jgi:ECF transporter S component (folate family)